MARFHQSLLVPGQLIDDAQRLLRGETLPTGHPILCVPTADAIAVFAVTFNNNYVMNVVITPGVSLPRQLHAVLYNQHGELQGSETGFGSIVDQDYIVMVGGDVYEMTIVRAANTVLTPERIAQYDADPTKCPACLSPDVAASAPRVASDNKSMAADIECCACGAEWQHTYTFTGINQDPVYWSPPTQNVIIPLT